MLAIRSNHTLRMLTDQWLLQTDPRDGRSPNQACRRFRTSGRFCIEGGYPRIKAAPFGAQVLDQQTHTRR